MNNEQIRDELAKWIDTKVIADIIIEELDKEDVDITFANAQAVWFGVLEIHLHENVQSCVEVLADMAEHAT